MPVLFINCIIITFPHEATSSEDFENIHQVLLDGIGDNVSFLVQYGKYGAMSTTDTTNMGYFDIKFVSDAYTLQ